jgi:hypothetical protein
LARRVARPAATVANGSTARTFRRCGAGASAPLSRRSRGAKGAKAGEVRWRRGLARMARVTQKCVGLSHHAKGAADAACRALAKDASPRLRAPEPAPVDTRLHHDSSLGSGPEVVSRDVV